ncbi:hypothetical protein J3F83DRAFT_753912 [Trichoderma novae-zelandiae]
MSTLAGHSALYSIVRMALNGFKSSFNPARQHPRLHTYPTMEDPTSESAGPATGLLAAYEFDPDATWLVLACDYPLITFPHSSNHAKKTLRLRRVLGMRDDFMNP